MKKQTKPKIGERIIAGLPEQELFVSGHRACAGCGAAIAMRHIVKATGKNVIITHATGCMEVVSSPYPETSWKVPWIHSAFENAAATASGIAAALKQLKSDAKVIAIAGDGGTFDIGLQALSGAIERNTDFVYICYDNGAYENTGIQRSGATPKHAWTTTTPIGKIIRGKQESRKNMPFIAAGHGKHVYVATANIAYPLDFYNKIKKALARKGPSYIQIYTPCVPGWRIPSSLTIKLSEMAFQSKVTPLFEIENGILTINRKPSEQKPVKDYLIMQGRFKHLNDQEIAEIQKDIDDQWNNLLALEKAKIKIP